MTGLRILLPRQVHCFEFRHFTKRMLRISIWKQITSKRAASAKLLRLSLTQVSHLLR